MDTKTLDERIREKARKELRDRIHTGFNAARAFTCGTYIKFNNLRVGVLTRDVSVATVLEDLEDSVFYKYVQEAEETAVAAFLAKVDTLSEEVQSLRDEVNGQ